MAGLRTVVLAALQNHFVQLSHREREELAGEIVSGLLKRLHETGALSVPPEDLDKGET